MLIKHMQLKNNKTVTALLFSLIFNFAFLILHFPLYALDVKRTVLDNGLTLLVVERHNLPVVMVTVGIKAGTLIEPEEKAGLSNLVAELLTEGTKRRTASEISEEIEFLGASLGSSGGDDYVTVSLSILKKDLDLGFDILSDIIMNPSFLEDEFNKKKKRIKGSLKAHEEDPGFVAGMTFKKAVFGLYPYGRLIEGSPETLDNIKQKDLFDFHSTYYVPNNTIMSVVGDITLEEVKALLSKYFSGWQKKETKIQMPIKPETLFASGESAYGGKEKKIITIDKDLTQANIIFGHIGVSRDNPDYYALSVMNYILGGGGFSSRLMQNIREEKGFAYDIHSFFETQKETGSFQIGFQTKNESANIAIDEVLKEINRIRGSRVSDTELSDAKAFLVGSFPLKIETNRKIANFLVVQEYYGLGPDYIDRYPIYINNVTKDDVLKVAKKYLDPERFVLVVVGNQKKISLKPGLSPN